MSRYAVLVTLVLALFSNIGIHAGEVAGVTAPPRSGRNVFAEFLGPTLSVGAGFDSRFRAGSKFGYRIGIAYTDVDFDVCDREYGKDSKGVSFPLEVNVLLGKRRSKFEFGLGVTPSVLRCREWHSVSFDVDTDEAHIITSGYVSKNETQFNLTGVINLGYRYQRERGFFLRAGLATLIGSLDMSPIDGIWVTPYLSLGYTF